MSASALIRLPYRPAGLINAPRSLKRNGTNDGLACPHPSPAKCRRDKRAARGFSCIYLDDQAVCTRDPNVVSILIQLEGALAQCETPCSTHETTGFSLFAREIC